MLAAQPGPGLPPHPVAPSPGPARPVPRGVPDRAETATIPPRSLPANPEPLRPVRPVWPTRNRSLPPDLVRPRPVWVVVQLTHPSTSLPYNLDLSCVHQCVNIHALVKMRPANSPLSDAARSEPGQDRTARGQENEQQEGLGGSCGLAGAGQERGPGYALASAPSPAGPEDEHVTHVHSRVRGLSAQAHLTKSRACQSGCGSADRGLLWPTVAPLVAHASLPQQLLQGRR